MNAVVSITQPAPVQAVVETITPGKAKAYLATMVRNRHEVEARIIEYAMAMDSDRWALNGETIKFNANGQLIDGQNRLRACILADKPFTTYVIRGLDDPRAFATVDVGKNRSHCDMLTIAGVSNQKSVTAAATLIILYDRNAIGWAGPTNTRFNREEMGAVSGRVAALPKRTTIIQKDELLAWVGANHDAIQESVRKASSSSTKRLIPVGTLAAAHFIGSRSGKVDADGFIRDLAEGANLAAKDPVHVLRERLLASATAKQGKLNRFALFGLTLRAMGYRIGRKSVSRMLISEGDAFPRI